MGYIVRRDYILVRRRVVNNMKMKLRYFENRRIKTLDYEMLEKLRGFLQSYLGHFRWANSYRLKEKLLKRKIVEGWFRLNKNRLSRRYGEKGNLISC